MSALVDVDSLGPEVDRHLREPSAALVAEKHHFGSSRSERWFGRTTSPQPGTDAQSHAGCCCHRTHRRTRGARCQDGDEGSRPSSEPDTAPSRTIVDWFVTIAVGRVNFPTAGGPPY